MEGSTLVQKVASAFKRLLMAFGALCLIAVVIGLVFGKRDTPATQGQSDQSAAVAVEDIAEKPVYETETSLDAQVFESDVASLEYRSLQDVGGNAVFGFMLTNKTDHIIMAYAENVVVNGQFSVQTLGGSSSLSGISPGTSGAFTFTFGVPTQTTLENASDITSICGDVRVYDKEHALDTLGYVHFEVEI